MAQNPLSNFKLPPQVKSRLTVCAKVLDKSMTGVLVLLIEKGYRDVVTCFPEKVQTIEAELTKEANGLIR